MGYNLGGRQQTNVANRTPKRGITKGKAFTEIRPVTWACHVEHNYSALWARHISTNELWIAASPGFKWTLESAQRWEVTCGSKRKSNPETGCPGTTCGPHPDGLTLTHAQMCSWFNSLVRWHQSRPRQMELGKGISDPLEMSISKLCAIGKESGWVSPGKPFTT